MNCDIRDFGGRLEIKDKEWEMIIESGLYLKLGKCYYTVYKNHVIAFNIKENNIIEMLSYIKKPCENYVLPFILDNMSFKKRMHCYLEQQRLSRGLELDVEHFKIYGT